MSGVGVKNRLLKFICAIVLLVTLQTLTYFTLGPCQLKDKLLTYPLDAIVNHSDSVFVRDFYYHIGDSYDNNIRASHHLNEYPDLIKNRLKVKYIYFDSPETFNIDDTIQLKFKLHYETYTERQSWITMFGFYSVKQVELLSVGDQYSYIKEVSYRWFFFFWIPTYEWIELNSCYNKVENI